MLQSGTAARSTSDFGIGLRFAWGIASLAVANVLRRSLEGHAPKLDANQRDTGRRRSVDATVLTLDLQERTGQRSGSSPLLIVNPRSMLPESW
jgi:hypothetical protein